MKVFHIFINPQEKTAFIWEFCLNRKLPNQANELHELYCNATHKVNSKNGQDTVFFTQQVKYDYSAYEWITSLLVDKAGYDFEIVAPTETIFGNKVNDITQRTALITFKGYIDLKDRTKISQL